MNPNSKKWHERKGLWYGVKPYHLLRVLDNFSQYSKHKHHRLRVQLLNLFAVNNFRFNGLAVKAYVVDNLDGEYKYVLNYFDRNHGRRITVLAPLKKHHYKYLHHKAVYGDVDFKTGNEKAA